MNLNYLNEIIYLFLVNFEGGFLQVKPQKKLKLSDVTIQKNDMIDNLKKKRKETKQKGIRDMFK